MIPAYSGLDSYAFLSYSHKDIESVQTILQYLNNVGCRIWYDEGIHATENWIEKIADKINSASLFIIVLSKNSVESKVVKQELNYASTLNIPILSFKIDDVVLPNMFDFQLQQYQMIKGVDRENLHKAISDIPKEIIGSTAKSIYKFNNCEYVLQQKKVTAKRGALKCLFDCFEINRITDDGKTCLFRQNIFDIYSSDFYIGNVQYMTKYDFHDYGNDVLKFEVYAEQYHMDLHKDLMQKYCFVIVNPTSKDSKPELTSFKWKEQYKEGDCNEWDRKYIYSTLPKGYVLVDKK